MDEILKDKLEDIRTTILETIFDNNSEKINRWKKDLKIDFDNSFQVLFNGDWTRNSYTKINLSSLLNTKNKPSVIFEEIKKELQRPKMENCYKCNFNPNFFFLFYDKFYNLELIQKKYKTYKLEFDSLKDEITDKIIGIQILDREKLEDYGILRKEIIRTIEIHSKILFNENLKEYLGFDFYKKIFIKNCVIQKEVQTYYNSRYIDLCYSLDKVILFPNNVPIEELHQNEKKNLFVEVYEEAHCKESDNVRTNMLISSSGAKIVSFDITDIFDQDGIKTNLGIITNLCKILIKDNDHKNNIMKLYLVEIEKLDQQFVNFIIDYKYKNKKFNIKSIFNIMSQNNDEEELSEKKILKILYKRGFFDSENYFEQPEEFNKIKSKGIDYLLDKYENIYLTRIGIENMFYSVDKKYWKNKDEFTQFKIDLEEKYLDSVENLLLDDTLDILVEENNLKNSVFYVLKNFDVEKYKKNIKMFSKYKNSYNTDIPFIIKSQKHSIDSRIIKLLISEELFEEYEKTNKFKKDCFAGWRFLYESEIKEIMNYENSFLD